MGNWRHQIGFIPTYRQLGLMGESIGKGMEGWICQSLIGSRSKVLPIRLFLRVRGIFWQFWGTKVDWISWNIDCPHGNPTTQTDLEEDAGTISGIKQVCPLTVDWLFQDSDDSYVDCSDGSGSENRMVFLDRCRFCLQIWGLIGLQMNTLELI